MGLPQGKKEMVAITNHRDIAFGWNTNCHRREYCCSTFCIYIVLEL